MTDGIISSAFVSELIEFNMRNKKYVDRYEKTRMEKSVCGPEDKNKKNQLLLVNYEKVKNLIEVGE